LLPVFAELAPLVVLLVELEEGQDLRIVGNLLGEGREQVAIGMPVEVAFETVAADVVLPQWRRRACSG
jgi:uncharacterized OB-fold protein